jgi:hypothetical protein
MVEHFASAYLFGIGNQKMIDTYQWPWMKRWGIGGAIVILAVGVFMRFYAIARPQFFLFDEGYYLNFNYKFVEAASAFTPKNFSEWWQMFLAFLKVCLGTGKVLWFVLVDARVFVGAAHAWHFPRIVSSVAGMVTILLTYFFAKRFYQSRSTAVLSVLFLAILPSHIFYSRLALQEAISGLFFLLGFYFYLFPQRLSYRTFLSAIFFSCAYFTNYRLILIPFLIAFTEVFWCSIPTFGTTAPDKNKIVEAFRKCLWHTLIFFLLVFFIGGLDNGRNIKVTFGWMFHQTDLAQKHVDWLGFLSYPYYLCRLEGWLLGILFFANGYLVMRKQWRESFPFLLVLCLMGIFSLTSEKGARYLCVGLPFVTMAVAYLLNFIFKERTGKISQGVGSAVVILLVISLLFKAWGLVFVRWDYQASIDFLKQRDPQAKILSTQPWAQNLLVENKDDVEAAPHGCKRLLMWYLQGYRYLIIDPQAYVSYGAENKKFNLELKGCLGLINSRLRPIKIFPHFNLAILERIVFEHNEQLAQSISFLSQSEEKKLGTLRIYDLNDYAYAVMKQSSAISSQEQDQDLGTEDSSLEAPFVKK